MASIRKDPRGRSPYWFACYRKEDGKRTTRSTETTNRRQAEKAAQAWERAAWESRHGRLTPHRAREIVGHGVGEIMRAGGEEMPSHTTKAWFTLWLETKALEVEPATLDRYKVVVDRFLAMLGETKAGRNLETLRPADLIAIRNRMVGELSPSTGNLFSVVVKAALADAVEREVLTSNPAAALKKLKTARETRRRPFTLSEIKDLLESAEGEWRGIILCGLYVGARLGDIARLRWQDVDLVKKEAIFTTEKTNRRMAIPLARPMMDYLTGLPSSDDPSSYIFPKAAAVKRVGSLSNQFHKIMSSAGLVTERKHTEIKHVDAENGEGREVKRETSEVSFHSLRHNFVSLLKAGGASDAIARELAGHESASISRVYTHFEADTLRDAVDALPDVTKKGGVQ